MNTVNLTGRLVADPELRALPSGSHVCDLRIAVDGMGRGGNDVAGYIDVASFGESGAAAARVLAKGWLVAVSGRLEHREWSTENGDKRNAYAVIGHVEFLTAPKNPTTEPEPALAGATSQAEYEIAF